MKTIYSIGSHYRCGTAFKQEHMANQENLIMSTTKEKTRMVILTEAVIIIG